jgi:hypothetical protein
LVVTIQKYRLISDLLTAWEAEGFAMGIDQQLKIRQLLQKIPDDYPLVDLKTLLAPIFAHDAKQQETFYEMFDVRCTMYDRQDSINEPPTSDIVHRTSDIVHQTTPSVWRLQNKRLWLSIGISLVFLTLLIIFSNEIFERIKPSPIPERFIKVTLDYRNTR